MSVFDVRGNPTTFDEIKFAHAEDIGGSMQAYKLEPNTGTDVRLYDGAGDYVYVNSADHARNLIKALEKAIEFGWLQ